jgi:hypothetical protein
VSDFCLGVALGSWNAEGSPPPGCSPPRAQLSRICSHIDRTGIRRFESYKPAGQCGLWAACLGWKNASDTSAA